MIFDNFGWGYWSLFRMRFFFCVCRWYEKEEGALLRLYWKKQRQTMSNKVYRKGIEWKKKLKDEKKRKGKDGI